MKKRLKMRMKVRKT